MNTSETEALRNRLDIINELHNITKQMVNRRNDADFLIESVDRRQALMDEYDSTQQRKDDPTSYEEQLEIRRVVKEIIKLDNIIADALDGHTKEAKKDLADSNKQQQVLQYTNQAMSASGSYMDYRK